MPVRVDKLMQSVWAGIDRAGLIFGCNTLVNLLFLIQQQLFYAWWCTKVWRGQLLRKALDSAYQKLMRAVFFMAQIFIASTMWRMCSCLQVSKQYLFPKSFQNFEWLPYAMIKIWTKVNNSSSVSDPWQHISKIVSHGASRNEDSSHPQSGTCAHVFESASNTYFQNHSKMSSGYHMLWLNCWRSQQFSFCVRLLIVFVSFDWWRHVLQNVISTYDLRLRTRHGADCMADCS